MSTSRAKRKPHRLKVGQIHCPEHHTALPQKKTGWIRDREEKRGRGNSFCRQLHTRGVGGFRGLDAAPSSTPTRHSCSLGLLDPGGGVSVTPVYSGAAVTHSEDAAGLQGGQSCPQSQARPDTAPRRGRSPRLTSRPVVAGPSFSSSSSRSSEHTQGAWER